MAIDIGRVAHNAFIAEISKGMSIPEGFSVIKWEDCSKREQDAWRHAAVAVLEHIEKERKFTEEY